MKNQYVGICFRCGGRVEADLGNLIDPTTEMREAWALGGWPINMKTGLLTEHTNCAASFAGTNRHWRFAPEA